MKRVFAMILFAAMVFVGVPFCSTAADANGNVCYIGDKGYASLKDAAGKVVAGESIRIVSDLEISENLMIFEGIRIYAEPAETMPKITVTDNAIIQISAEDAEVVFENLIIQANSTKDVIQVSGGTLIVTGEKTEYSLTTSVTSNINLIKIPNNSGAGLRIYGGVFTSDKRCITVDDKSVSNLLITGGTFTAKSNAVVIAWSNMNITGGTFISNAVPCISVNNATGKAYLHGGTFVTTNTGKDAFVVRPYSGGSAMIYDGTYISGGDAVLGIYKDENSNESNLFVFGGKFYSKTREIGLAGDDGKTVYGKYYIYGGEFYNSTGAADARGDLATGNLVKAETLDAQGLAGEAVSGITVRDVEYKWKTTVRYHADADTEATVKFQLPSSTTVFGTSNAEFFISHMACNGTVITALHEDVSVETGKVRLWNLSDKTFTVGGEEVPSFTVDDGTLFAADQFYAQTRTGTTLDSDSADVRFVGAFKGNPADYVKAGYLISLSAANPLPNADMCSDLDTNTLYRSVIAAGETINAPDGSLWLILTLSEISQLDFDTVIFIRAYAVTEDGNITLGKRIPVTVSQLLSVEA